MKHWGSTSKMKNEKENNILYYHTRKSRKEMLQPIGGKSQKGHNAGGKRSNAGRPTNKQEEKRAAEKTGGIMRRKWADAGVKRCNNILRVILPNRDMVQAKQQPIL